jgi:hypothetical protein
MATIDNHQLIWAYHHSSQENIPGQPRQASKLPAAHSSNAWTEVSSHQGTRAGIKRSLSVDLLGPEHQPTRSNNTTPATTPHQQHHHTNNITTAETSSQHITITETPPHNLPCSWVEQQGKIHTTSTPSINQTSKTKDQHGYLVQLGTRSSS